jgi:uncharacterized protein with PIN domain
MNSFLEDLAALLTRCPECDEPIVNFVGKCPQCGADLTEVQT